MRREGSEEGEDEAKEKRERMRREGSGSEGVTKGGWCVGCVLVREGEKRDAMHESQVMLGLEFEHAVRIYTRSPPHPSRPSAHHTAGTLAT